MSPDEFAKLIEQKASEIRELHDRTLPIKGGAMAKAHFQDNFRKGGFVNDGLQRWKPKKKPNGYKELLSGKNHLFSSIQSVPAEGEVRIVNTLPYAAVHNEGLQAGRGKGFTMPKRQFIGESKELNEKIEKLIDTELSKILNS